MGTSDILQRVTLRWTSIPSGGGGVAILSIVSCYRNWDKLRPCGPHWLVCDFTLPFLLSRSLEQAKQNDEKCAPTCVRWKWTYGIARYCQYVQDVAKRSHKFYLFRNFHQYSLKRIQKKNTIKATSTQDKVSRTRGCAHEKCGQTKLTSFILI